MIPFRFGSRVRQLNGVFHQAAELRVPSIGVLLCNPFGQEAIRTHRLYCVLSERLALLGFHVLRFDYYGTGDSAGDDEEGELLGWVSDTVVAHAELVRRSGSTKIVWIGARLGGTIAALSSALVDPPIDGLVLWEPLIDGLGYLNDYAVSPNSSSRSEARDAAPPTMLTEALGFCLHPILVRQLEHVTTETFRSTRAHRAAVIVREDDQRSASLALLMREAIDDVRVSTFAHAFDFNSDEALNTSIVPIGALQVLISRAGELAS